MEKEQYQQLEQYVTPKPPYLKNIAKAFFVGGLICAIGQAVSLFTLFFQFYGSNSRKSNCCHNGILCHDFNGLGPL